MKTVKIETVQRIIRELRREAKIMDSLIEREGTSVNTRQYYEGMKKALIDSASKIEATIYYNPKKDAIVLPNNYCQISS